MPQAGPQKGHACLVTEGLSCADLLLIPVYDHLLQVPEGLHLAARAPNLQRWWENVRNRPSVEATRPGWAEPHGGGPVTARSFLDGALARLIAFAVFLACGAALAWLHRDDLWPADEHGRVAEDPMERCIAERRAEIARMADEGLIQDQQVDLFTARAEALCQAEAGTGGGPPALPAD